MEEPMSAVTPVRTTIPAPSGAAAGICLALARSFLSGPLSRFGLRQRAGGRFESYDTYLADRTRQVDDYGKLFSRFSNFEGRTVLDLGCSSGYLLAAFLDRQSFTAIGADADETALARGRAEYGEWIRFIRSGPASIPMPDASVDVIYSTDTFEHLSQPGPMLAECHRVLRPGGRFLIHFHPWLGPYGSHLDDVVTFPWAHVVFSMDTLLDVAAYLYESDQYDPACYWFDWETGQRRANPFADHARWREFLNRLTLRRFRRLLRESPFGVLHFEPMGFGGTRYRLAGALRGLARVPVLQEFASNGVFCVLRKMRGD
jgi:SAM-dependent methyltransferase